MNIEFVTQPLKIKNRNAIKVIILLDKKPAKYEHFINIIAAKKSPHQTAWIEFVVNLVQTHFPNGVFWECVGCSNKKTMTKNFECTFVSATTSEFAYQPVSPAPFMDKMCAAPLGSNCISFWNIGQSARLVVPMPHLPNSQSFGHFASIHTFDNINILATLWAKVGRTLNDWMLHTNEPVYLSTHGLGVNWIHFRLDKTPKYYKSL